MLFLDKAGESVLAGVGGFKEGVYRDLFALLVTELAGGHDVLLWRGKLSRAEVEKRLGDWVAVANPERGLGLY